MTWSIGATAEPNEARVRLQVDRAGGDYSGTWTAQRQTEAGDWIGVRAAQPYEDTTVMPWIAYDYEAPPGTPVIYRVVQYPLTPLVILAVTPLVTTVPFQGSWLKDPGQPALNTRIYVNDSDDWSLEPHAEVIHVYKRSDPIVLSDVHSTWSGSMEWVTVDEDQARAVYDLILQGSTLLLDTDPAWNVPVRYVSVMDTGRVRWIDLDMRKPQRIWSVSLVGVAVPYGPQRGARANYASLMTAADTYQAVLDRYPTYLDALEQVTNAPGL